MGGTALLIYGDLSADRLEPRPLPRTWLDRLLGRTRKVGPRAARLAGGRELVEVDPAGLEPLATRFRAFLAREIPEAHDATGQILEYLDIDGIPSLYLRGEREAGRETEWYVQLGFSGCAGMAEVSAAVAEHWAAAWARRELGELEREVLRPLGFTPRPDQRFEIPGRFLPAEELGYLSWLPEEHREADGAAFEVDYAVEEAIEDTPARIAAASERLSAVMADGKCRCQLCAPEVRPLTVGLV